MTARWTALVACAGATLLLAPACGSGDAGDAADTAAPQARALDVAALAECLAERGVVYYGSALCRACGSQQRAFGASFVAIPQVECHPHAPGSDPERCIARDIRVTPTWLVEREGDEVRRLEGVRSLEELAAFAGCPGSAP